MINFLLAFYVETPFFTGMISGGALFGGLGAAISWTFGYEAAMRKALGWMHPTEDEPVGDVPNLPVQRDRRYIPTVGRS
jgi:hypothetical protein